MDKRHNKQIISNNVSSVLLTITVITAYLLIDGMGMYRSVSGFIQGSDAPDFLTTMVEQFVARIVHLALILFPIVFVSIKYHMSFRENNTTGLVKYIPFVRLVFGLLFFYYAMTIGTHYSHEVFIGYYSTGNWFLFFRIAGAFTLLGAFVIDWPSAIKSIRTFPSLYPRLYKGIFIVITAICSCALLEFQVGSKMNMMSSMLVFNVLYWIIIQLFIDVLTRTVKIGAVVSLSLAYLIGLINDIVYQFRGNYVIYGDLTVVRTALEVAGNYTYKPGLWFWISLALLVISIVITILLRFPRHNKAVPKEIAVRAAVVIALIIGVAVTFRSGILYNNIYGVGWDYNKNIAHAGYAPYFLSNMNSIKSVTLDGYEAELASEVLDQVPADDAPCSAPNIIIIQNEAFSDLSIAYDIETNQDYMPFIHSLVENTRKGYLNMSVTGGPTANTEFEILMRSTLNFLPFGSVPYTQYVNDDLPSAVQVLRHQPEPYYTVAYHSYYSSGYRRVGVYDHFGFDESVFEDHFRDDYPETDLVRDLLSDSADYRRVERMYEDFRSESDAPWFCFNVTVQNHGGYTLGLEPSEEDRVYVTNFEATDSINEYLSLIKISDDAFSELIEYFSQCDEPTIIAMYGDHQPSFDEETISVLSEHPAGDETDQIYDYYVPYVIWANFDIDEEDNLGYLDHAPVLNTLSTNYFVSTVFDIAGVALPDYDRYLLDLHERVPAITAIGVWDSDGNYYASAQASPYAEDLSALQMVQYNLIFDDDNRLTDRFM